MTNASNPTVKYGTATVGVGAGNALAYVALEYMRTKDLYTPDDPVVAMAMGGALVSMILLEAKIVFRGFGRGVKYVFDRIFPPKEDK